MTLEEIQQDEWYQTRPDIIKRAIDAYPPIQLYTIKHSGKRCFLISYEEPDSGAYEDITVTVEMLGEGGPLAGTGLELIDAGCKVFGLKLDSIE